MSHVTSQHSARAIRISPRPVIRNPFTPHNSLFNAIHRNMTTDTSAPSPLFSPFLEAGFKQDYVQVPPPASDPTLSLKIHTLVKQPTSNDDSTKTIVFLHGHPQSNVIWHRVIPLLQSTLSPSSWHSLRIIIPDLRGHGLSGVPDIQRDNNGAYKNHAMRERYSKRQMGRDIVQVVDALGCTQQFSLVAHDRGAVRINP